MNFISPLHLLLTLGPVDRVFRITWGHLARLVAYRELMTMSADMLSVGMPAKLVSRISAKTLWIRTSSSASRIWKRNIFQANAP